jgi:CheY-like chemotaxis protein
MEDDMLPEIHDGEASVRILIVEDDQDTGESMARLLRIFGYEVEVAREGSEAIQKALRQRPDFVLLDIGLPGMDGYQVALTLKRAEPCKDTIIIAVTGYGQSEDRQQSHAAGIDHHLVKPIDHGVLLALMAGPERSSPENRARPRSRERPAEASDPSVPGWGHDGSSAGGPGPPSSGVPMLLASRPVWRGDEPVGRPPSSSLRDR